MAKLSGQLFDNLGGAAGDLFGAIGSFQTAKGFKSSAEAYLSTADTYKAQGDVYAKLAGLSQQSKTIAQTNTNLQLLQTEREINGVIGGQRADIAGAGLEESGGALDLLRSSASQGSLTMAVARTQGALDQQGYEEEALSYQAMQKASEAAAAAAVGQAGMAQAQAGAAKSGGIGGIIKGALKIGASFLLSDARMKDPILWVDGEELGLPDPPDGIQRYMFKYRGGEQWYIGVLAQEVMQVRPDAVHRDPLSGILSVNYDAIGEHMYLLGNS